MLFDWNKGDDRPFTREEVGLPTIEVQPPGQGKLTAKYIAQGSKDNTRDVALIQINSDVIWRPKCIAQSSETPAKQQAAGYTVGSTSQIPLEGKLRNASGQNYGTWETSLAADKGFSGAPVFGVGATSVIGMIQAGIERRFSGSDITLVVPATDIREVAGNRANCASAPASPQPTKPEEGWSDWAKTVLKRAMLESSAATLLASALVGIGSLLIFFVTLSDRENTPLARYFVIQSEIVKRRAEDLGPGIGALLAAGNFVWLLGHTSLFVVGLFVVTPVALFLLWLGYIAVARIVPHVVVAAGVVGSAVAVAALMVGGAIDSMLEAMAEKRKQDEAGARQHIEQERKAAEDKKKSTRPAPRPVASTFVSILPDNVAQDPPTTISEIFEASASRGADGKGGAADFFFVAVNTRYLWISGNDETLRWVGKNVSVAEVAKSIRNVYENPVSHRGRPYGLGQASDIICVGTASSDGKLNPEFQSGLAKRRAWNIATAIKSEGFFFGDIRAFTLGQASLPLKIQVKRKCSH